MHLITGVLEAIEAMRVALGPTKIMQYALQGLFHPARKIRNVYWKIYNSLVHSSRSCSLKSADMFTCAAAVHRFAGRADSRLPAHRRRQDQHVQALGNGDLRLNAVPI